MNNGGDITQEITRFVGSLTYEDLTSEAVEWAKYLCLDFAGVTLNGSTTDSARAILGAIKKLGRPGSSVVIGTSDRTLPENAALANGAAFHSIELDDVNNEASLHPGVVVYPTALAMADVVPVDGKSFITSVVAGYDVIVRLGRALRPAEHYSRGFHPTATCGSFGAAAVSSRLLGLTGKNLTYALGIAGSQAAGSMEFLAQGAWTKRFHPGWAAHSGMWAAFLAQEGFIAPTSIIEGKSGFLRSYSGDPCPELVLNDLGETFHITRTSVKPHSCCRYNQGPIDCVLELVTKHDILPENVKEARVGVLSAGYNLVAAPEDEKRNPESVVDMQFSLPFATAISLKYGRASLQEYTPEIARRQDVKDLMSKVRCITDPALDAQYPRKWPAWAEIDTRDGQTFRSEIQYPKGDPENALSWGEMKDKFINLSAAVISEKRQQEVIMAVESLQNMRDMRELADLLTSE
jgi:2-methylcitrate dehydratase PrpD